MSQILKSRKESAMLSELLFQPYQRKILTQYGARSLQSSSSIEKNLRLSDAIKKVRQNEIDNCQTHLKNLSAKVNSYLLEKIVDQSGE